MKRQIVRRDVYAELTDPAALIEAMEAKPIGTNELGETIGVTNAMISHLRRGNLSTCTPQLAQLIEDALDRDRGSLFTVKRRAGAQRMRGRSAKDVA
jgi:DNA-binding Xre family transcriptional regulator